MNFDFCEDLLKHCYNGSKIVQDKQLYKKDTIPNLYITFIQLCSINKPINIEINESDPNTMRVFVTYFLFSICSSNDIDLEQIKTNIFEGMEKWKPITKNNEILMNMIRNLLLL